MDMNKAFYKSLFKNLFSDSCDVQYWDGKIEHLGTDKSKFKLIFNEVIHKSDIVKDPFMAFGEGYMNKKIDIEGSVQEVIESIYNNSESFLNNTSEFSKLKKIFTNNIKRSKENIQHHYDIGNDFYKLWLDETMTYSCGYFRNADDSLNAAQKNKVQHILRKLNIEAGQTLLDIGCGWGELIITAAKQYGVKALGITLSLEQYEKVKERIEMEGLNDLVKVELIDYRELKNKKFDRVVSVGMVEHVGKEHLHEYFSAVSELLEERGLSMLHCITGRNEDPVNSWIDKYIFPGGYIPSLRELVSEITSKNLYLIDLESLRRHYAMTLECWARNFESAMAKIEKMKDETFIRMWTLYLNGCAAAFNCGSIDIHQFLFTKGINNELPLTREYIYKD